MRQYRYAQGVIVDHIDLGIREGKCHSDPPRPYTGRIVCQARPAVLCAALKPPGGSAHQAEAAEVEGPHLDALLVREADLRRGAGWFVWLGRGRRVGRWLGRCWAEGSVGGTVCAVATLLGRGLWYIW